MSDEMIFGVDADPANADELMNRAVRSEWVQIEGALYTGKWFDYRFMTPVQATYLYAHEYKKAFQRAFRTNISVRTAQFVKPWKSVDVFHEPPQTVSGLWRGRQTADAMGMPYDVYLTLAFEWNLRYWRQKYLPRPQQMYSDLVTDRAAESWEEHQGGRLYYSRHENYLNRNYAGLQSQNDHHEWLFLQASKRRDAARTLGQFLVEELIMPEKIEARYGAGVKERALYFAELNRSTPSA